jgi:hypothetical protein
MEIRDEIDLLEKTVSLQGGRIAALTAAVAGILQAAKGNPEVAKAVLDKLEQENVEQLARPQNKQNAYHLQSFEVMREYLRKLVE